MGLALLTRRDGGLGGRGEGLALLLRREGELLALLGLMVGDTLSDCMASRL